MKNIFYTFSVIFTLASPIFADTTSIDINTENKLTVVTEEFESHHRIIVGIESNSEKYPLSQEPLLTLGDSSKSIIIEISTNTPTNYVWKLLSSKGRKHPIDIVIKLEKYTIIINAKLVYRFEEVVPYKLLGEQKYYFDIYKKMPVESLVDDKNIIEDDVLLSSVQSEIIPVINSTSEPPAKLSEPVESLVDDKNIIEDDVSLSSVQSEIIPVVDSTSEPPAKLSEPVESLVDDKNIIEDDVSLSSVQSEIIPVVDSTSEPPAKLSESVFVLDKKVLIQAFFISGLIILSLGALTLIILFVWKKYYKNYHDLHKQNETTPASTQANHLKQNRNESKLLNEKDRESMIRRIMEQKKISYDEASMDLDINGNQFDATA